MVHRKDELRPEKPALSIRFYWKKITKGQDFYGLLVYVGYR